MIRPATALCISLMVAACESGAPPIPQPPGPRGGGDPPKRPGAGVYSYYVIDKSNAATIHESGWKTPIKLGFNNEGWEDSPYLTRDGRALLLFWHPSDRLGLPEEVERVTQYVLKNPQKAIANGMDGKVYVSAPPFKTRRIHEISQNKKFPAVEACPYISLSVDYYYCSTLESFISSGDPPSKGYVNKRRIDLGTGDQEGNHHYCAARDELWFDCPGDTNICYLKNAVAADYKGVPKLAPSPINKDASTNDSQPFLTDDCRTMFFTSDRDGVLAIYKSKRDGETWSEPRKFVSHPAGVAELSLTTDGAKMAFAQLIWRKDSSFGIDIWYAEKKSVP